MMRKMNVCERGRPFIQGNLLWPMMFRNVSIQKRFSCNSYQNYISNVICYFTLDRRFGDAQGASQGHPNLSPYNSRKYFKDHSSIFVQFDQKRSCTVEQRPCQLTPIAQATEGKIQVRFDTTNTMHFCWF